MPDSAMDSQADDQAGIRWLSYSQIAALRGISRTSAERMVRRAKWRRQVDNQGVTRAAVPLAYAEPERATLPDSQAENPPDNRALQATIAALREAKTSLQAAFDAALSAKDGEIATLRGTATAERSRADRAEAAAAELRLRLDDLGAKLADAQAELAAAQDQAVAATHRAVAAVEAEQAVRQAAAELRMALTEAEADAAELRQVEVVRKGRGRLARLLAAWRRQ